MRALSLQKADVAQGGQSKQAACGSSLSSNFAPQSLENKFLAQASTLIPPLLNPTVQPSSCSALQPSHLSSTSSSLLSFFSSPSSSLLSTQNKLLESNLPLLSFSLASSASKPSESLLTTILPSSHFAQPSSLLTRGLSGEKKSGDKGDEGKEETSEVMQSCSEHSRVTDSSSEEEEDVEEDSAGAAMELAVPGTDLGNQELEKTLDIRQEEFAELQRGSEVIEEELKDKKYFLLNNVCCSLVGKLEAPGEKDWDKENSVWTRIMNLGKEISDSDPQFLLKVAVYTRQELNVRITANFLLALAANLPPTKCHVRRYFCAAVQLPSDWLEVVRIYSTCFSRSLPMCLKKGMADKFKQFSEYQLAKYNTRKHRCKHSRNRRKANKPTDEQLKHWGDLLRSDKSMLAKFLQVEGSKTVVDKKQSEFSIKKMIKRFHIKEPAEHVMAILGKKYPADQKAFNRSGMKGAWDREQAGKRMKLKEPETWERLLSREGNKASTWEKLIDNNSLPFMAMLRNLRNMIMKGISEAHHEKILSRLTNKKSIIQSRQFPFRFLAAYKVIMQLNILASATEQALPPVKEILQGILEKIPKSRRFKKMEWDSTPRSRLRVTLGVPFVYRLYKMKKAQLMKANERLYTVPLLDRYRRALETAVQLSCRYNVPPLPGRTLILLSANISNDWEENKTLDFCVPPDPEEKENEEDEEESRRRRKQKKTEEDKVTPNSEEKDNEEEEEEDDDDDEEEKDSEEGEEEDDDDDEEEKDSEEEGEDDDENEVDDDDEEEEMVGEEVEEKEEEQESRGRKKRKKTEEEKLTPTSEEIATLLALMIMSSAEDSRLITCRWNNTKEVKLKSDVLLENVRSVVKNLKTQRDSSYEEYTNVLPSLLTKKNKVNNIIMLDDYYDTEWTISNYRKDVNNKVILVKILTSRRFIENPPDRNCVTLTGFSEQILRFVAERGSARLLDHVEHLDKLYKIPPPEGAEGPLTSNNIVSIPVSPKLRWRGIRVFISSTFRDMHAERDILVKSIFPELRRRAAAHCLYLQEIELRWGVTEEESERATELCLSEVCRSQMMVGILGERYGLVPPRPVLPDLPQYNWLASAPAGLSVTEMEIRQFQALYPDTANQRMFCYFRDPNITKSIPVAWRSHFAPESNEAESKMASLKRRIRDSKVKVTENYPGEWGGVVEGKPYLKNLEVFGKAVLEDLWTAVVKQFVEEDVEAEAVSEVKEQEVHQGALQRHFFGRGKLLDAAIEIVEQVKKKGGMMVVEAGPGEGKTVFMAALAEAIRTGVKSKTNLVCDVMSYSTAASQAAASVENLLRCLMQWLKKLKTTEEETPLPTSYKDMLTEFQSTLSDIKTEKPLVLLVDGVDLVKDARGQLCLDWIPQQLPQAVCLVVSITSKAALLQTLAKKKNTVLFYLRQLTLLDRKEIVQKELDSFGKKLSESAFNNQLQILVMKRGAVSPLYLHMACEDLRNFASFDKLKESLEALPQNLSQLVQFRLERLCLQHRDMQGLRWALSALYVSATGLRERDFCSVLNTCNDLSSLDGQATWQRVLQLSRKPKGRVPMATFTCIVQSLQSLIGPSHCHATDDMLVLTNLDVRRGFEHFLLPTDSDRTRAHLVLAAHLWAVADPQGTDTFLHCEANSVMHLPSNLIQCGQMEALHSLLSSYYFLYAKVRHGLLHQLLVAYRLYDNQQDPAPTFGSESRLEDCRSFLKRHATMLSSWPALFVQQAINEPPGTSANTWAKGLEGKGGVRVVHWLNNDNKCQKESSELVSTFASEPTCLVMNSELELIVVGTGQGMLHFINTQTKQEVKTLVSSCDGISSCVFLKDGRLATTSFDGRIEMWDIGNSCRTAVIEAHTNIITASDVSADKKHFATVSLDFSLKVWSSIKANEVAAHQSPSPLNCVTFDPKDHLLAAGCWNGNVVVWKWLQNKTLYLCGHKCSVRSLSFTPSSSMLCSGSVSGEVRVWSVPTSTCVGCFQAHSGSTESLTFLGEGNMLLSGGCDHTLQLWSGGLGRSVAEFKSDECDQEPPRKKQRSVTSAPAALCVAVHGDCAVVGYHGDGIKFFSLESGDMIFKDLDVSVPSLRWIFVDPEHTEPELLVSSGSDVRMRMWKKKKGEGGVLEGLEMWGILGGQSRPILAIEQNSKYMATASDDGSIVLWLLSEMAADSCPEPHDQLRGHTGGVTCLSFSPDGEQLLSGGKDMALVVWDVSVSPAVVSKSLPHSHRDWITGCAWTPDCVVSSSNDGRLCFWDLQVGKCLKEISWNSALTSLCSLGKYVISGCAEGALHVWNWETNTVICHIAAHKQRIHHCSLLPNTDKNQEVSGDEMTVLTASDDGTVQIWKPLEVDHFNTFQGHNGSVHGVVLKEGLSEFLTVSEDCSLRCWPLKTEGSLKQQGPVTALCFHQRDDLLLVGYESGFLEIWQHNKVVGHKQASGTTITAICSMPNDQFALGLKKPCVDVWKLLWNQQHNTASVVKLTSHKTNGAMLNLIYCSALIGWSDDGILLDVTAHDKDSWNHSVNSWHQRARPMDLICNDEKSMWLVAELWGEVNIGFLFSMGSTERLSSGFSSVKIDVDNEEKSGSLITAATVDKDFIVCGDSKGNMWFIHPPEPSTWRKRKPAHSNRISVLKLTESTIISASFDRTVKLWDRKTKKQVGMFVCGGPVVILKVNPNKPTELVCGDSQGKIYFLSWKE